MLHQRCVWGLLWNGWRWHHGKCNAGRCGWLYCTCERL